MPGTFGAGQFAEPEPDELEDGLEEVVMRVIVVVAVVVALAPALAAAQQTTGDVRGRVVDASGRPVADVEVTAPGPGIQGQRRALSDDEGRFRLLALPAGSVWVELARIGYRPVIVEGVEARLGHTTELADVTLEERPAELPALVVTAERGSIDLRSTAVATELPAIAFERFPVGRDYASLLTLLPQANQSYYADGVNVAGGTGLENAYFIDGVNVTEPYRGAGGIDLPHNFIERVQLLSGCYEAKYGRALGGVVNVVTRSAGTTRVSRLSDSSPAATSPRAPSEGSWTGGRVTSPDTTSASAWEDRSGGIASGTSRRTTPGSSDSA